MFPELVYARDYSESCKFIAHVQFSVFALQHLSHNALQFLGQQSFTLGSLLLTYNIVDVDVFCFFCYVFYGSKSITIQFRISAWEDEGQGELLMD